MTALYDTLHMHRLTPHSFGASEARLGNRYLGLSFVVSSSGWRVLYIICTA